MTNGTQDDRTFVSPLNFHLGGSLLHFAQTYETMIDVIGEAIQNALDSKATKIWVRINKHARVIYVRDNGCGISQKRFEDEITVGKSIKGSDSLGQFGIGLISPVDKCKWFTITSCAAPNVRKYLRWKLVKDELINQGTSMGIPGEQVSGYRFDEDDIGSRRAAGHPVPWRTEIAMHGYTTDQAISTITMDRLVTHLHDEYSPSMQIHGTTISIAIVSAKKKEEKRVITANSYTGHPIALTTLQAGKCGRVSFRLFRVSPAVRKTRKRTKLNFGVGDNAYRINWTKFRQSVRNDILPDDVVETFASGIFEGEILGENLEMTPRRTGFTRNDALLDFCICLEEWVHTIGKLFRDEERLKMQEERYQSLGQRALSRIEQMLKDPNNAELLKNLKNGIKLGTIGPGHAQPKKRVEGKQRDTSIVANEQNKAGAGHNNPPKDVEHGNKGALNNDTPYTAQGPRGTRRDIVKDKSLGLQYVWEDFGMDDSMWKYYADRGLLAFNKTHPTWVECEKKDWMLLALMENITFHLIVLESAPEDRGVRVAQRRYSDQLIELQAQWLLAGGSMSRRRS